MQFNADNIHYNFHVDLKNVIEFDVVIWRSPKSALYYEGTKGLKTASVFMMVGLTMHVYVQQPTNPLRKIVYENTGFCSFVFSRIRTESWKNTNQQKCVFSRILRSDPLQRASQPKFSLVQSFNVISHEINCLDLLYSKMS